MGGVRRAGGQRDRLGEGRACFALAAKLEQKPVKARPESPFAALAKLTEPPPRRKKPRRRKPSAPKQAAS